MKQGISEEEAKETLMTLGVRHTTLKMVGCNDWSSVDDPEVVIKHLRKGAELSGMTVVGDPHYKFNPQGLTAGVFLAESHVHMYVYFHSWPEKKLTAWIDICACRPKNLSACIEYYVRAFKPAYWLIEDHEEGTMATCPTRSK